jgi:hypothetical protein
MIVLKFMDFRRVLMKYRGFLERMSKCILVVYSSVPVFWGMPASDPSFFYINPPLEFLIP